MYGPQSEIAMLKTIKVEGIGVKELLQRQIWF